MLVCLEFQSDFLIKSKFMIIWWFSVMSNIICLLNTAQIQFIKEWDWNFKKLTLWALAGSAVIWNFPSTQRQITCWGCVQKPWNRESKDLQRESSNRSTVWSEQNLESFENMNFRLDIKGKTFGCNKCSKNNKPSPLISPHLNIKEGRV